MENKRGLLNWMEEGWTIALDGRGDYWLGWKRRGQLTGQDGRGGESVIIDLEGKGSDY